MNMDKTNPQHGEKDDVHWRNTNQICLIEGSLEV